MLGARGGAAFCAVAAFGASGTVSAPAARPAPLRKLRRPRNASVLLAIGLLQIFIPSPEPSCCQTTLLRPTIAAVTKRRVNRDRKTDLRSFVASRAFLFV